MITFRVKYVEEKDLSRLCHSASCCLQSFSMMSELRAREREICKH